MTVVCDLQACNHHTEWGAHQEEGVEELHPPSRGFPAEHRKESRVRPLLPQTMRRMLSWVPTPIALRQLHVFSFTFRHTQVWVWVPCWPLKVLHGEPPHRALA